MSRVLVIEYVSLDGVIQAPGHSAEDTEGGFEQGGWTGPHMREHALYNSDLFQTAGAFLLGRLTYEIWAEYWPTVTDEDDEIARALNTRPKYVASRTLAEPAWEGTIVIHDVPAEIAGLKERPGRPIFVLGSSQLAQSLADHGLVDEYRLWMHPIVLGSGKRLFREGGPRTELELVDSRTTAGGLVMLTYRNAGQPSRAPERAR
jgi:dihydrofolate reductase